MLLGVGGFWYAQNRIKNHYAGIAFGTSQMYMLYHLHTKLIPQQLSSIKGKYVGLSVMSDDQLLEAASTDPKSLRTQYMKIKADREQWAQENFGLKSVSETTIVLQEMSDQMRKKLTEESRSSDEIQLWSAKEYMDRDLKYRVDLCHERNDSFRFFIMRLNATNSDGEANTSFREQIKDFIVPAASESKEE